jgi:hypothetical protein
MLSQKRIRQAANSVFRSIAPQTPVRSLSVILVQILYRYYLTGRVKIVTVLMRHRIGIY